MSMLVTTAPLVTTHCHSPLSYDPSGFRVLVMVLLETQHSYAPP